MGERKTKEKQLIYKKRLVKFPSSPHTQAWQVMHADHKWKRQNECNIHVITVLVSIHVYSHTVFIIICILMFFFNRRIISSFLKKSVSQHSQSASCAFSPSVLWMDHSVLSFCVLVPSPLDKLLFIFKNAPSSESSFLESLP